MLNPVLDTMRCPCAASRLQRVQNEVCGRKVSLGSFSEAQGVFDPELLERVFIDLAAESQASWGGPRLAPLADRYHGLEYGFFGELWQIEASHVFRIRNNPRPCS